MVNAGNLLIHSSSVDMTQSVVCSSIQNQQLSIDVRDGSTTESTAYANFV